MACAPVTASSCLAQWGACGARRSLLAAWLPNATRCALSLSQLLPPKLIPRMGFRDALPPCPVQPLHASTHAASSSPPSESAPGDADADAAACSRSDQRSDQISRCALAVWHATALKPAQRCSKAARALRRKLARGCHYTAAPCAAAATPRADGPARAFEHAMQRQCCCGGTRC